MKNNLIWIASTVLLTVFTACSNPEEGGTHASTGLDNQGPGQSAVSDDDSQKDIVKIAVASKDHSTLVTAVQAANLVDVLSNAGPFTVFAPINSAFEALPAGTVEGLLEPENNTALQNILEYHVAVAVYNQNYFQDGQILDMVNGDKTTIHLKDGMIFINDAKVLGNVKATNGIVYVIDKVLLPQ